MNVSVVVIESIYIGIECDCSTCYDVLIYGLIIKIPLMVPNKSHWSKHRAYRIWS